MGTLPKVSRWDREWNGLGLELVWGVLKGVLGVHGDCRIWDI